MFAFRLLAPLCASVLLLAGCGGGGSGPATQPDPTGPGGPASPGEPGSPGAGVLMSATSGSAQQSAVAWRGGEAGGLWRLERRRDDGSTGAAYALVAEVDAAAGVWLDSGLEAGTLYAYRLVGPDGSVLAMASVRTGSEAALMTSAPEAVGNPLSWPLVPSTRRLVLGDSGLQLDLPAGSLTRDGTATLQPVSNPLPEGNGLGAGLALSERPAKTLQMTMRYGADDDVDEVLQDRIAMRQPDGSWWLLPLSAHGAAQRTLHVDLPPSVWVEQAAATAQAALSTAATVRGVQGVFVRVKAHKLVPAQASVRVLGSQRFVPVSIYVMQQHDDHACDKADGGLCVPTPVLRDVTVPILNTKPGFQRQWTLQGSATPDAALGTLAVQAQAGVVYTAPGQVPATNPLTLRFESIETRNGRRLVLTAPVRVVEDAWLGRLESFIGDLAQGHLFKLETRWALDATQSTATRRVYRAAGTAEHLYSILDPICSHTVAPTQLPLEQARTSGQLVVDESVSPSRYSLDLVARWDSMITVSCPSGSTTAPFPGGSVWSAQGVVSNGRIEGTDNGLGERSWSLGRPQ